MAALHEERGEHEQQEAVLRAVLRADPYREHNHRAALMTLLATEGRGAETTLPNCSEQEFTTLRDDKRSATTYDRRAQC
jgi:hypothetical protein